MKKFLLLGWLLLGVSVLLTAADPPDSALSCAPVSLSAAGKAAITPLLHADQAIRVADSIRQTDAAPAVSVNARPAAQPALKTRYVVYLARSVVTIADLHLLRTTTHKTAGSLFVCVLPKRLCQSGSGGLPLRCLPLM
ncbi:hypothetical protein [Arsenicibacter rosenii]|uniref:Uncharacterized protein n=1 Tax=Arsenicibacter rosenii TaxID=1750698 RepID=A0A1S2VM34_9BACT|nr:hypothetical protein [Arsenicibacter rosenii]OIN59814.1 hypothetical protein BLX24_08120 [Arsenicibacter rosenii]